MQLSLVFFISCLTMFMAGSITDACTSKHANAIIEACVARYMYSFVFSRVLFASSFHRHSKHSYSSQYVGGLEHCRPLSFVFLGSAGKTRLSCAKLAKHFLLILVTCSPQFKSLSTVTPRNPTLGSAVKVTHTLMDYRGLLHFSLSTPSP